MFLPIVIAGLLLFLGLTWAVIRVVRPKDPRLAWRGAFIFLVVACTADHLIGYAYARMWVLMAKGAAGSIESDSVAYQYSKQPLYRTWYDPLGDRQFDPWPPGYPVEVYAGYLAWKAAEGFALVQGYPKSYAAESRLDQLYEIRLSTNPDDPECKWWDTSAAAPNNPGWNEDRLEKDRWLAQVRRNWDGAERVFCPALHPVAKLTAKYLVDSAINLPAGRLERALGLSAFERVQIVATESNEVVAESRAVRFQGGWLAQLLSSGYEFGLGSLFARQYRTPELSVVPAHRPSLKK